MLATVEIKKSIYRYLTNLGLKVKDTTPANTQLPYVQFGDFTMTEANTKTNKRQSYILTLHVWCVDSSGYQFNEMLKQVLSILEDLKNGNNQQQPQNYELDQMDLDFFNTLKEQREHDVLSHGVVQIKFTVSN